MHFAPPKGISAGFHFHQPEPGVPELVFCGEYWAEPEWRIDEHQHHIWEFYFQIDGESEWRVRHKTFRLHTGALLAVAPHVPHHLHRRPRAKHHFYYAAIDLPIVWKRLRDVAPLWRDQSILYRPQAESVAAPFRQLVREVVLSQPHRHLGLHLALDTLVLEVSRTLSTAPGPRSLVGAHPAVIRIKELLDHQCQRPWRLENLSRVAGLSPTHLAEVFTRDVGVPPRQYLLQVRIERAKQYLRQKAIPITTLGLELGFSSSQHFATTFKHLTGKTPREYARASG